MFIINYVHNKTNRRLVYHSAVIFWQLFIQLSNASVTFAKIYAFHSYFQSSLRTFRDCSWYFLLDLQVVGEMARDLSSGEIGRHLVPSLDTRTRDFSPGWIDTININIINNFCSIFVIYYEWDNCIFHVRNGSSIYVITFCIYKSLSIVCYNVFVYSSWNYKHDKSKCQIRIIEMFVLLDKKFFL